MAKTKKSLDKLTDIMPDEDIEAGLFEDQEEEAPSTLSDAINKTTIEPPKGIGPIADGEKYAQDLKLQSKVSKEGVPSPVKTLKRIASAPEAKQKQADFSGEIQSLKDRITEATATRDEERKRADVGQLAETIGRSLTQIGAAQAGLKSNVDLSNVLKGLPPIDWAEKRKEIADDYKTDISMIGREQETLARKIERSQDKEERAALQKQQMAFDREKLAAEQDYRNKALGIQQLQAETAKQKVGVLAAASGAKQALKAMESQGKIDKQYKSALDAFYAASDSGDSKAQLVAMSKLPIEVQKEIKDKSGWFGPSQKDVAAEIAQRGVPSQPAAAPSAPAMAPQQPAAGQDPTVLAYAQKFNLDYNRAKDILTKRGHLPKE